MNSSKTQVVPKVQAKPPRVSDPPSIADLLSSNDTVSTWDGATTVATGAGSNHGASKKKKRKRPQAIGGGEQYTRWDALLDRGKTKKTKAAKKQRRQDGVGWGGSNPFQMKQNSRL